MTARQKQIETPQKMNIAEALAKSIKSGNAVRIRTNDSARAIAIALENAGCDIRSEKRIDDTRAGSSLSALEIGGEKDGKRFEIVAAGARF
jgi:hypothetical protein